MVPTDPAAVVDVEENEAGQLDRPGDRQEGGITGG